jgi:isopentenyldiphosphate isomerase
MSNNHKLNILNKKWGIIGEETRENIHNKGLLHYEIHVCFYTPKGEIIFQHRGKNKDIHPNLLDVTVGGHVEIDSDYENTALREIEEETGIKIEKNNFTFIQMMQNKIFDSVTNKINNFIRAIYAYRYEGKITNLRIEKGEAIGFELWSFEKFFNISNENKKRFVPFILNKEYLEIFAKVKKLI